MATATLQTVSDDHRTFESRFGELAAFDVSFTDGRQGQVVTKVDTLERKQAQFRDLIGTETQFILEDAGSWPDGNPKPLRVKLPAFGGGPGGGGTPSRPPRDEAAITRAVALKAAVAFCDSSEPVSVVLATAEEFHDWLRKTSSSSAPAPHASARSAQYQGTETGQSPVADDEVAPGGRGGDSPAPGGHTQDCRHPESSRRVTPSGKVRCTLCSEVIG